MLKLALICVNLVTLSSALYHGKRPSYFSTRLEGAGTFGPGLAGIGPSPFTSFGLSAGTGLFSGGFPSTIQRFPVPVPAAVPAAPDTSIPPAAPQAASPPASSSITPENIFTILPLPLPPLSEQSDSIYTSSDIESYEDKGTERQANTFIPGKIVTLPVTGPVGLKKGVYKPFVIRDSLGNSGYLAGQKTKGKQSNAGKQNTVIALPSTSANLAAATTPAFTGLNLSFTSSVVTNIINLLLQLLSQQVPPQTVQNPPGNPNNPGNLVLIIPQTPQSQPQPVQQTSSQGSTTGGRKPSQHIPTGVYPIYNPNNILANGLHYFGNNLYTDNAAGSGQEEEGLAQSASTLPILEESVNTAGVHDGINKDEEGQLSNHVIPETNSDFPFTQNGGLFLVPSGKTRAPKEATEAPEISEDDISDRADDVVVEAKEAEFKPSPNSEEYESSTTLAE